jgi:predicted nucleic acid-binding protein
MTRGAQERSARITEPISVTADFEPLPFDDEAVNAFDTVAGFVVAAGRNPKPRKNDLMIAATAVADGLPLYATNVGGFKGLESVLDVVEVRAT